MKILDIIRLCPLSLHIDPRGLSVMTQADANFKYAKVFIPKGEIGQIIDVIRDITCYSGYAKHHKKMYYVVKFEKYTKSDGYCYEEERIKVI